MALKCSKLDEKIGLPFLETLKEVSEKARDLKIVTPPRPCQFVCPILKEVMNDPCLAVDGYTYDRKATGERLQEKDTLPVIDLYLIDSVNSELVDVSYAVEPGF